MRRVLAGLVVVLVVYMTSVDPLVCPDGCTDDHNTPRRSTASVPGACCLCQAGVVVTATAFTVGPPAPSFGVILLARSSVIGVPRPSIERPPRHA